MNWPEFFDRAKLVMQALSVLGPYVIWPALLWLWRIGVRLRKLLVAAPKILRALAIFGNRERRAFDVDRRLLFYLGKLVVQLRFEAKLREFSHETQAVLEVISQELPGLDKDIHALRDTGFRAREIRSQREQRDSEIRRKGQSAVRIEQGELDAGAMGPIDRVLGE